MSAIFKRDDAAGPAWARRGAPAAGKPGVEVDVGAVRSDDKVVLRHRSGDARGKATERDRMRLHIGQRGRDANRALVVAGALRSDVCVCDKRRRREGSETQRFAAGGKRERRMRPCTSDPSRRSEASAEIGIDGGEIGRIDREVEHVSRSSIITGELQPVATEGKIERGAADVLARELDAASSSERQIAPATLRRELERERRRPFGLERTKLLYI